MAEQTRDNEMAKVIRFWRLHTTNPDSRVQADFAKTRQLLEEALKPKEAKSR